MQVFVIINNVGRKISVDANVKSWLKKVDATKDSFGILVTLNAHIADTEYPQGRYSTIFAVKDFSRLFVCPSIF